MKHDEETLELAEEHIKLAEELVSETAKDEDDEEKKKLLTDAELSLEKAEADIEDSEN
jgi:hypothetical protein